MCKKKEKCACGPWWVGKWGRCLLSGYFNEACVKHDEAYETKKDNQQDADIKFLEDCIRISKGKFLREVQACIYFILIRIGGKFSWDKDK